ncbi:MAG: alkaline phosphatase family protein [Bacteriovorax sp.]|nr:alkaline phosphatase family protein [Bacteriovorax sp.]
MKNIFLTLTFLSLSQSIYAANFNKVLVIVFENTEYSKAIQQPFFSSLVKEGALFTNFKAAIHPSLGNYIAMIAGTTFNIVNDKPIDLNERHIGDLLEDVKKDWKVYAEDYPGNCFLGKTSGDYARKHVPFMSFVNVQKNPARCAKIVEAKEFFTDFSSSKLKDFSMYIPNLKNDGHDTGIAIGDKWFKKNFDSILHSPNFPKDLLVVVTFDEGTTPTNQIYTLLFGANIKPGAQSARANNFYTLLRTYEDGLGLGSLNKNDVNAQIIDDVWKK